MAEDEDPIVGAGGANKPEKRNRADNADSPLPEPKDGDGETSKGRSPDDE